jgi:hypothetical protein
MPDRPTKISFGEMRDSSVRGLLVYCADYAAATTSRSAAIDGPTELSVASAQFIRLVAALAKLVIGQGPVPWWPRIVEVHATHLA